MRVCVFGHGPLIRQWAGENPLELWRCRQCALKGNPRFIYPTEHTTDKIDNPYFVAPPAIPQDVLDYLNYLMKSQLYMNMYRGNWNFEVDPMTKKEVHFCKTHEGTIIELKFITFPVRNHFKNNYEPIINLIKTMIPAIYREYNPRTLKWSFLIDPYWEPIEKVMRAHDFEFVEVSADPEQIPNINVPKEYAENFYYHQVTTSQESATSIAEKLSIFLGVKIVAQDLNELKKIYRKKAMELHPDRGGDASAMSELNRLWTLYCDTGVKQ